MMNGDMGMSGDGMGDMNGMKVGLIHIISQRVLLTLCLRTWEDLAETEKHQRGVK